MKTHRWMPFVTLGLAALTASTSCSFRTAARRAATPEDPVECGWLFACAITNDARDRAKHQERAAQAWLARGQLEQALARAKAIEGWRRGVVLAEAAARYAEAGETNTATRLAAEAESIARNIQDWQRDRILVRTAKTGALLGMGDAVSRWSAFYATNRDYRGETAAYHALALARSGQLTNALAVLDGLADTTFIDVSSWRVAGYLMLATDGRLGPEQSHDVFSRAWAAAERVPGAKRVDVRLDLARSAIRAGETVMAHEWLSTLSSNLLHETDPHRIHLAAMTQLAVLWADLKDVARVEACAARAEPLIASKEQIEQPGLLALLGEAWARAGEPERGVAAYAKALDIAATLVNPRPRAGAGVDVCLSLERSGLRDKRIGDGLNRLLATFGATHG